MDNALFLHYPEVIVPKWQFRGINFEKGWRIVFVLASMSPYLTLRLPSVHICGLAVRVRAPRNEMRCNGYPFRRFPWCIFVNLYHLIRARCVTIRLMHATIIPRKFIISLLTLADSWEMNQRCSRENIDSRRGRRHLLE